MSTQSFIDYLVSKLKEAGVEDTELIRANFDPENFGNAEALFHTQSLDLRFRRDRGQEFLELATTAARSSFTSSAM